MVFKKSQMQVNDDINDKMFHKVSQNVFGSKINQSETSTTYQAL